MPRCYQSASDDAAHDAQADDADAFGVLCHMKAGRLHEIAKNLKSDLYPSHTNAMLTAAPSAGACSPND
jgi:hypothetical protein